MSFFKLLFSVPPTGLSPPGGRPHVCLSTAVSSKPSVVPASSPCSRNFCWMDARPVQAAGVYREPS